MTATQTAPALRSRLAGRMITPESDDYDDARQVFLGDVDRRPDAIVRVADAHDVARVVEYARENGVELTVRAGGHSNAGQSAIEGGLVLDVRDLNALDIDVAGKTAWAGAGLTAAEFTTRTNAHGVAVGFGDTGSVGIAGITLGGGIGYLVRKHGLTIDSLLGAEIVTADGEIRQVDAGHEPDLFWAIRGGGGNFGVATRFQYALHDVRVVTGGLLMTPATPETVAGFIDAAEAAPEDVSAIANVMPAPPAPFVPPEAQGKLVIFGFIVHAGDLADGERALAPFRSLATPVVDMLGQMPYPQIYGPEDPNYRPTPVQRTMFLDGVTEEKAAAILKYLEASDASIRAVQLRVLGGAAARVPVDATAFAHRRSRILTVVVAFHDNLPGAKPRRREWVDGLSGLLRDDDPGAYVNFLSDEGPAGVHAAYPGATWDRLVDVKRRYDPTNLFHHNQNIPPG